MSKDPFSRHLDRSAIILSGLCLVHCLAFPILIAFLPALDNFLPRQWWVHPLILAIALPLAGAALWRGWHRHHDLRPPVLGAVGLFLLTIGILAGEGGPFEIGFTVAGGLTLVAAHVLNWRLDGHRHAA